MSPTFPIVAKPSTAVPLIRAPATFVTVPVVATTAPESPPLIVPELVSVPSVVLPSITTPTLPPSIDPELVISPAVPAAIFTPRVAP